jgi:hypothetical protein
VLVSALGALMGIGADYKIEGTIHKTTSADSYS